MSAFQEDSVMSSTMLSIFETIRSVTICYRAEEVVAVSVGRGYDIRAIEARGGFRPALGPRARRKYQKSNCKVQNSGRRCRSAATGLF